jgi:hypothetical protein
MSDNFVHFGSLGQSHQKNMCDIELFFCPTIKITDHGSRIAVG